MKNLIKICILLYISNCMSQSNKGWTVTAGINYNVVLGDNFLSKGYGNGLGRNIEIQYYSKKFFIGLGYHVTTETVKNKELIGDFKNSDGECWKPFIGYKQNLKNNKMFLEHRIGIGSKKITNYSEIGEYNNNGTIYTVGTRYNYVLNKNLIATVGFDFDYTIYNINDLGTKTSFYDHSVQITPILNIKLDIPLNKK